MLVVQKAIYGIKLVLFSVIRMLNTTETNYTYTKYVLIGLSQHRELNRGKSQWIVNAVCATYTYLIKQEVISFQWFIETKIIRSDIMELISRRFLTSILLWEKSCIIFLNDKTTFSPIPYTEYPSNIASYWALNRILQ